MATTEERLAALEDKLKLLETRIAITDNTVVIGASSKVVIKAPFLELYGQAGVVMKGSNVEVSGGMNVVVKAVSVAQVQGAIVRFNGGTRAVAYSGSQVIPSFPPMMKVDWGNPSVLV